MKKLSVQKRLAADLLKCSKNRVRLDPESTEDIQEAITKRDVKSLIDDGVITETQKKGVSRARANRRQVQKSHGQRKGQGKRKGKNTARLPRKELWMSKIRAQRDFLRELRDKDLIDRKAYRNLYQKSKGGFFRSRRHIKIYLNENRIIKSKEA